MLCKHSCIYIDKQVDIDIYNIYRYIIYMLYRNYIYKQIYVHIYKYICIYIYIYFMWCEIERYIYMQTLDLLRIQLNKVFCSFQNLVLKLQNVLFAEIRKSCNSFRYIPINLDFHVLKGQ